MRNTLWFGVDESILESYWWDSGGTKLGNTVLRNQFNHALMWKVEQVVLISTAHLDKSPCWADESTDWVKGGMRKNIKVKYVLHKVCCKIVSEYNLWLTRLKAKWGIFIGINLLLSSQELGYSRQKSSVLGMMKLFFCPSSGGCKTLCIKWLHCVRLDLCL